MKARLTASDVQQLLALPGYSNLLDSLYSELAEYTALTQSEVAARRTQSTQILAREWRSKDRSSLESQIGFYIDNEDYLYELAGYNSSIQFAELGSGVANFGLLESSVHTVIDFGAGIGSLGIILASLGFEVILTDIARPLLKFARWRFEKRGLEVEVINLLEQHPAPSNANLVCALDTLEHISDLKLALGQVHEWLRPNGWFIFNTFSEEEIWRDLDHPMHITSGRRIFPAMRSLGFDSRRIFQGLVCYRKPTRHFVPKPLASLSSQTYWFIRWKGKKLLKWAGILP